MLDQLDGREAESAASEMFSDKSQTTDKYLSYLEHQGFWISPYIN